MQAAAGAPPREKAALGPLLSQAKAAVLKDVGAGVVGPLDPLAGAEENRESTGALLAERLLAAAVAAAPDPEFRAWVEGLWAEAGVVER